MHLDLYFKKKKVLKYKAPLFGYFFMCLCLLVQNLYIKIGTQNDFEIF